MRGAILSMAVAAACLVAAGCQRPQASAEVQRVRDGVAAYRAGDRDALTELLTKAADYKPDDDSCSTRAWAETRREAVVDLLEPLDKDALFAVSEEARFAYLERRADHAMFIDMPRPLGCNGLSRHAMRRDASDREAVITAFEDEAALWKRDLEAQYGETEFRQRMIAAHVTLRANRIGETRLSRVEDRDRLRRRIALEY